MRGKVQCSHQLASTVNGLAMKPSETVISRRPRSNHPHDRLDDGWAISSRPSLY